MFVFNSIISFLIYLLHLNQSTSPSHGIQGRGSQSLPYTVKRINGKKNFECNVCTKTFSQLADLNVHLRTHAGERPYVCQVCNKRFTQLGNLNIHYLLHTGEKPHRCDVCKKRFAQKRNLDDHFRIHTETQKRERNCKEMQSTVGPGSGKKIEETLCDITWWRRRWMARRIFKFTPVIKNTLTEFCSPLPNNET